MDARLRKRRGILRVSASRHIDCSVRRRPSRAGAFLRRAGKLVSSGSRPADALVLGLSVLHPAAVPPAAVLLADSAALAHRARDAPSSAFRPRSPRSVLAISLNEWRKIVHPAADFASRAFQKPPLIRKCSKSRHSFEASPLSSGDYRRKARPSQAITFQKPPLISGYQLNRRSFEQRSRFRRLSPSFFKTHRSAYSKAKHAK